MEQALTLGSRVEHSPQKRTIAESKHLVDIQGEMM